MDGPVLKSAHLHHRAQYSAEISVMQCNKTRGGKTGCDEVQGMTNRKRAAFIRRLWQLL
jgi:hypothetical protein